MKNSGLMLFAKAPWGSIELKKDSLLTGFSLGWKLYKIFYKRRTKSTGSHGATRSESSRGWAHYLDFGKIERQRLPLVLSEDGTCSLSYCDESSHGSVDYEVKLKFYPPRKVFYFFTSLRVDCELNVDVDISR